MYRDGTLMLFRSPLLSQGARELAETRHGPLPYPVFPRARRTRDDSMQAIFAGRMIEGAGSPLRLRSEIGTSPGQDGLSALVIITIQMSSSA
jgi:hypothetical protein